MEEKPYSLEWFESRSLEKPPKIRLNGNVAMRAYGQALSQEEYLEWQKQGQVLLRLLGPPRGRIPEEPYTFFRDDGERTKLLRIMHVGNQCFSEATYRSCLSVAKGGLGNIWYVTQGLYHEGQYNKIQRMWEKWIILINGLEN